MKINTNNFLTGIGNVLNIFPCSEYIYPEKDAFAQDKKNMEGDALAFVRDLNRISQEEYGKIQGSSD